jgi:hypothetical protein
MRRGVLILLVLGAFGASAPSALATFPGRNGLLAVGRRFYPGIRLVSARTGKSRTICARVDACGGGANPRWSPDGQELVSSIASGITATGIAVLYPDGACLDCQEFGSSRPMFTDTPGYLTAITDGQLNEYAVDGLLHSRLLKKGVADAVWSADNRLAIVRSGRIWVGTLSKLRSLGRGGQPSWSPNGSEIAAVRRRWIVLLGVRRRSVRHLVRGTSPAFSPDGRWLAFISPKRRLSMIRVRRGAKAHTIGRVTGVTVDWQPLPARSPAKCAVLPGMKVLAGSPSATIMYDQATPPGDYGGPQNATTECLKRTGRSRLVLRNAT